MSFYIKLVLLSTILLIACVPQNDKILSRALDCAGENRQELEKVLHHYKNDPEKLAAARFLIVNMPYHYTYEQYLVSPQNERFKPNITTLDSLQYTVKLLDSLKNEGYKIESNFKYDISTLDSRFLIDNIELAFTIWKKPWAKNVSFIDFCRYILPYRAQTEEVSHLRKEIMERFVPILDSANVKTSFDACTVLNKHLKGIMKYGHTGLPFYPTIDETYCLGISLCEGLCNLGAFIMRACGIPVAIEQTIWTKMNTGHSWCAVLDNGKFYSFDPGGVQPADHARRFTEFRQLHPAKVYRSHFDPDFTKTETNDDGYITELKSPLRRDVTNEYLDKTTEIEVLIDGKYKKKGKSDQIYLCTYNDYEWYPIAIGRRKDSIGYFENFVGDNIFIVADSPEKGKLRIITAPFYVSKEGDIHKFIPQKEEKQTFTLNKLKNKLDVKHFLHYWDTDKDMFIPIEYVSVTDTTQIYNQIPVNALLWFAIPERIPSPRMFFIENDSMKAY